ncbi:hypothetical protein PCANC_14794 [Puccinia coronata f. sp. avenae]|uniref:Uncharacterized protein n=1 Tax=Puccinia coronata f. sp. avenae TaxID=200324 RepID=A0A2N5SNV3_9BASI|nr:hypothetical protein PCANC_14794 [Puccinia coronata f. sp. avenae]
MSIQPQSNSWYLGKTWLACAVLLSTQRDDFPTHGEPRGRRGPSLVTGLCERHLGRHLGHSPCAGPHTAPALPRVTGADRVRLQPELSQAGPNDNLEQTAWYRPSTATGLEGAT